MADGLESTLPPTGSPTSSGDSCLATLTAVHPPELTWQLVIDTQPVIIGREGFGVHLIGNRTVSRRHVGVTWNGTCHVVSDLGSRNGCKLEGRKLDAATVLEPGDVIQLGDVFLIYERGDPALDDAAVSQASIPGRSFAARQLRVQIARAAVDPSPVLLLGETGTGKEWITRELHRLSGRSGPLVALNCAALGSQIVESQLFGHLKGAFTGATSDQPGVFRAAHGGTLFLDELGELPLDLQPKLLRALQDGLIVPVGGTKATPVDVRVIAATNKNLQQAIDQHTFRLDLYSRLAMWEIAIPPLRARRVDILPWISRLSSLWCVARSIPTRTLTMLPDAVESLLLHPWPDNLRGIDRLVHVLRSNPALESISPTELPAWLTAPPARPLASATSVARQLPQPLAVAPDPGPDEPRAGRRPAPSREEFSRAYEEHAGNVRALSRHFDRDRRQIYRWMDAYGLARKSDD
ncbi:MAG: sigma 54-interacting transcriptional regulator [Deltaproteobacteria bacterium]|nr:sigma 54-interacting transcriptional regulator [Deltaproteobacteria bacterium]